LAQSNFIDYIQGGATTSDWPQLVMKVPDISLNNTEPFLQFGEIFSNELITDLLPSLKSERIVKLGHCLTKFWARL